MPCKPKMKKRKKYNIGGNIKGPSHDNGGVVIEAEGGEYIINNKSVNPQTERVLEYINKYGKLPSLDARKRGGK
jgi:vacuolar-type H+-ATPase subunit E/Vma4